MGNGLAASFFFSDAGDYKTELTMSLGEERWSCVGRMPFPVDDPFWGLDANDKQVTDLVFRWCNKYGAPHWVYLQ